MEESYMSGKVYIYNKNQKDFYIKEGCRLLDADIHKVTKKIFWVFNYDEVQEAFEKWCLRKH